MSHSTVLVIGEDPEKMLEPYNENTDVEPYRSYDDTATPQEHYMFSSLVEEHGLPASATWADYCRAYNEHYGAVGPDLLLYDSERDRVYTMSTYNPQSKWDWYQLGGRWTGFFKLTADARGEVGEMGLYDIPAKAGWVDQARRADIDFDGMRAQAEAQAISNHAQVRAVLAGLDPIVAWDVVREERFPGDIDAARRFYNSQPGMKALRAAEAIYTSEPVEYYCLDAPDPLAAYIAKRRQESVLTFAVLNADGWHERGRMGWWGVVTDETEEWPATATRLMDEAEDGALFSVYDVHI